MAKIEGFRVRNYRALCDITLGQLWNLWREKNVRPLTPMTAVIGKNGVGKSSLFDAFGFLADCLKVDNVENNHPLNFALRSKKGRRGFLAIVLPWKQLTQK